MFCQRIVFDEEIDFALCLRQFLKMWNTKNEQETLGPPINKNRGAMSFLSELKSETKNLLSTYIKSERVTYWVVHWRNLWGTYQCLTLITIVFESWTFSALDLKLAEKFPRLNFSQAFSRWRSFFSIVLGPIFWPLGSKPFVGFWFWQKIIGKQWNLSTKIS